ncbi:MAG: aldo/keto reductase [Gammaproteobacteria bacterium]|nr:aldo/keto reductase [Gammaproteobacteria bacterium]
MNTSPKLPGCAEKKATLDYCQRFPALQQSGHFSDFLKTGIKLSSLGVGTFSGAATPQVDESISQIVETAICNGVNVIDTANHYRYGQSLVAVARGIRAALNKGFSREQLFLVSKAGFLVPELEKGEEFVHWFKREYVDSGLGSEKDLTRNHLLSPAYFEKAVDHCCEQLGVETVDAFLVDQPEVHIPAIGKEQLNQKLLKVFEVLERKVQENKIRYYGISTFNGFRVETDDSLFQSLTSMLGLAEKAAQTVSAGTRHHFRLIQLPFNQIMPEGFTRFNQATGQGNIASTLQAAFQLKLYVMASHTLAKGHLASSENESLNRLTPALENAAQRAMQFNRSTPGVGTSLVGLSQIGHLHDFLKVVNTAPLSQKEYLSLYQKAD